VKNGLYIRDKYNVNDKNRTSLLTAHSTTKLGAKMEIENGVTRPLSRFTYTQKGKRLLTYDGFNFYQISLYKNTIAARVVVYWQSDRRKDAGCLVNLTTDEEGSLLSLSVQQEFTRIIGIRGASKRLLFGMYY